MKKKELYEAPSVETYDLVPESNLLQGASQKGGIQDIQGDNVVNDTQAWGGTI